MRGAEGFAKLFETGQYGRLYIVSASRSARGATFRLFVLPAGEQATPNGPGDAPLNSHAVEVYDIADDAPGTTASSSYGCLLEGDWKQDFASLVEARCAACDQCVAGSTRRRLS